MIDMSVHSGLPWDSEIWAETVQEAERTDISEEIIGRVRRVLDPEELAKRQYRVGNGGSMGHALQQPLPPLEEVHDIAEVYFLYRDALIQKALQS